MEATEHNTEPRYSERDLWYERKRLAAEIRSRKVAPAKRMTKQGTTWNEMLEYAAKIVEPEQP